MHKAFVGTLAALTLFAAPALAETVNLELWARKDTSGPLRAENVVKAADKLNAALKAEGSDTQVQVTVHESPAPGFDEDALQLLRVFGIGQGPDVFVAAHEWVCAFQKEGFALKLDDAIAKYPDLFGKIQPSLWNATECKGGRYAVPQDAEARMFFYNKKLLRKAGFDDATIEALPQRAMSGDLTMDDLIDIAKQVIDKGGAKYGILHRPTIGPDYIMVFQSYGNSFIDPDSGNLLLERDKLAKAFGWFERAVKAGVIPANNTSMEWDTIKAEFYKNDNAAFWMYGIWDLGSAAFPTFGVPSDETAFFKEWGWIPAPPVDKGGKPSSLTHPIVYAVGAQTKNPDLAVRLLGYASSEDLNTDHAVSTTHLGIRTDQIDDPRYTAAWTLAKASELLPITKFLPNNPQFGDLNRIIYGAIQGVEAGKLTAQAAADYVVDQAQSSLEDVMVK
jgi:inositol-phosphate transport system substrate-binding protein